MATCFLPSIWYMSGDGTRRLRTCHEFGIHLGWCPRVGLGWKHCGPTPSLSSPGGQSWGPRLLGEPEAKDSKSPSARFPGRHSLREALATAPATGSSCYRHLIGPHVLTLNEVEGAPFLGFPHWVSRAGPPASAATCSGTGRRVFSAALRPEAE